jgi:hypothetical protein
MLWTRWASEKNEPNQQKEGHTWMRWMISSKLVKHMNQVGERGIR